VDRLAVHGDERVAEQIERPFAGRLLDQREVSARHQGGVRWKDDIAEIGVAPEDDALGLRLDLLLLAGQRPGSMSNDDHFDLPLTAALPPTLRLAAETTGPIVQAMAAPSHRGPLVRPSSSAAASICHSPTTLRSRNLPRLIGEPDHRSTLPHHALLTGPVPGAQHLLVDLADGG